MGLALLHNLKLSKVRSVTNVDCNERSAVDMVPKTPPET